MLTIHKHAAATPGRRGFREQCDKYTAVEKRRGPTEGTRTCALRDMIEHIQDVKILGFLINTCRSMERLCILASENG